MTLHQILEKKRLVHSNENFTMQRHNYYEASQLLCNVTTIMQRHNYYAVSQLL